MPIPWECAIASEPAASSRRTCRNVCGLRAAGTGLTVPDSLAVGLDPMATDRRKTYNSWMLEWLVEQVQREIIRDGES